MRLAILDILAIDRQRRNGDSDGAQSSLRYVGSAGSHDRPAALRQRGGKSPASGEGADPCRVGRLNLPQLHILDLCIKMRSEKTQCIKASAPVNVRQHLGWIEPSTDRIPGPTSLYGRERVDERPVEVEEKGKRSVHPD